MFSLGTELNAINKTCQAQVNGWWQIEFTLDRTPDSLLGMRFKLGDHLLAVWRVKEQRISCLAMPSTHAPDITQPIFLASVIQDNPKISTDKQLLVIGQDLGIADVLLFCQQQQHKLANRLILLSADIFPFIVKPAKFMVSLLPEAIGACPLLEDWGIANRLFSHMTPIGCYDEDIDTWLKQQAENIKQFEMIRFQ